ncbi:MAG: tRNA-dihydrouridine synthase, partial [Patescibacteria group bacterium]|nr:tRNA-dihydrouridine synthase [Patescibacteria group bacterium]
MSNIWHSLSKPIFCLAPMFGATDSAFRQLLVELGRPDLMFTEFINVQAIFSPDQKTVSRLLSYTSKEQPLIAQIWGLDPELFAAAADLLV